MDDPIFDGWHDKRTGLEDLPQTPHVGSSGEHVPRVRPGSRPSEWNP